MVLLNGEKPKVLVESGAPTIHESIIPLLVSAPVEKNMYTTYSYSNPVSSSYSTSSHHNEYKYNVTKYMTKPQNRQNVEYIKTYDGPTGLCYETIPLKTNTNNIFEISPSKEELNKITYNPRIEVYSTSDFVVIMMNLPGISKENLNIELEKGLLKIFGQKYKPKIDELERQNEYHTKIIERVSEYYFCKIFQMPPAFSEGQSISCTLRDGELVLKMLASEVNAQKKVIHVQ
ncbi:heat shock protein 20, putative [Plasmodium ovale curtisi]|uniref:Heat shock protein 20, putative n=1 Tax=Plasmodium ovale curtisi TaxID=864141 RepID=A0A1A8WZQ9_PLAOA|nr:heat shock protein 20, putative [Plasmodium ovale curtisi]SBS97386.1 heat shock protein 20, putative [Plasmodium ovale curtisi]